MSDMTKKHFIELAEIMRSANCDPGACDLSNDIIDFLVKHYPKFDEERFRNAAEVWKG